MPEQEKEHPRVPEVPRLETPPPEGQEVEPQEPAAPIEGQPQEEREKEKLPEIPEGPGQGPDLEVEKEEVLLQKVESAPHPQKADTGNPSGAAGYEEEIRHKVETEPETESETEPKKE